MQAITQHRYGSPDVFRLVAVPAPAVGARDVLIEVHAASVTHADRRLRSGDFPGIAWLPGRLTLGVTGPRAPIPGTGFAGRVVAVGRDVTRFAVGDDVFGNGLKGAYAERVVMPQDGLVARMPAGVSYAAAATLPYGALTALLYLRDLARVRPGERVCVLGASGGVGRFAVQLAAHMGAEVTGVCSARHHAEVARLGAHRVVDYRTADLAAEVAAGGPRFDVILDATGGADFGAWRGALTAAGRYLSLIVSLPLLLQMAWTSLFGGRRAFVSVAMGGPADLDAVRELVASGAMRPAEPRTFSLAEAALAHARFEAREDGPIAIAVVPPAAARAAG